MKVVLKACNFIKKRLQQRCFHVNISKVLGAAFYTELWCLLLKINFSMRKDFFFLKLVETLPLLELVSYTNTRAYKQVTYHKSICLSHNVC